MPRDFLQRRAYIVEAEPATCGHDNRREIFLSDDVEIHMQHKLTTLSVQMIQRVSRGCGGALCSNILGTYMAKRRTRKKFLLWRIKPSQAEKAYVRFAHEGRFAPEAHQLRRTFAD